jgi:dihydroorotate dehydrogenase (fumarate)
MAFHLSTTLAGKPLERCIMNASGCHDTTYMQMNQLGKTSIGVVVSKSGTFNQRKGNEYPRVYYDDEGSLNSVGLANEGYQYYSNYSSEKKYMMSIHPFSCDELAQMLDDINSKKNVDFVEVNLSCPNVERQSILVNYFDTITQSKATNLTVGVKLPLIFDASRYEHISHALLKSNIKFVTCSNSLPNGLMINRGTEETLLHPNYGLGAVGGTHIKSLALANVHSFYRHLRDKIDIIGCGGIKTGGDAFDYILCGAKAVQVGTQLLNEGSLCFDRLHQQLLEIMRSKKYTSLSNFRGNLNVCQAKSLADRQTGPSRL